MAMDGPSDASRYQSRSVKKAKRKRENIKIDLIDSTKKRKKESKQKGELEYLGVVVTLNCDCCKFNEFRI